MPIPKVVARCGDLQHAPESTLPAFEQAIAKGADTVEFDVHLTRDGELVVHHDFYLGRTNDGSGYIGDCTLAELKALDAGSWFDPRYAGVKIPRLQEVVEAGRGRVRFEIDMKGSSLTFLNRVIDEVNRLDILDDVELTSAHVPLLAHARRINPKVWAGMFFYPLPEWMGATLGQRHILDWMMLTDAQVAHLHPSLLEEGFLSQLHESGFLVHGSNLNTEEEIDRAVELGTDQFSTDRLELAVDRIAPLRRLGFPSPG